jgi:hypothetical protein
LALKMEATCSSEMSIDFPWNVSQQIEPFITTTVRTSEPVTFFLLFEANYVLCSCLMMTSNIMKVPSYGKKCMGLLSCLL